MANRDIIVVGASAGGVEALIQLVGGLPKELSAAVFIVLHIPSKGTSVLANILSRAGKLPATVAVDNEPIQNGRVYTPPPDHHLLVEEGFVRVVRGPKENGHRPAVDPLFRTAAYACGNRVIGVVLSGSLDDGSAGLQAIKMCGGIAIAQDPKEALYPSMPANAIEMVGVDHVLTAHHISDKLVELVNEPIEPHHPNPVYGKTLEIEAEMSELDPNAMHRSERPGEPSGFGCPSCGGSLFELSAGGIMRYRCRVGHAWSVESLMASMSESLEEALWVALRALEEKAALSERMMKRAIETNRTHLAERFEEQRDESRHQAEQIRVLLLKGPPDVEPAIADDH